MHKTNISIVLLKVIMKEEASAQRGESTLSLYTTGKMGSFLPGTFICPLGTVSGLEAKGRYCCGCVWILGECEEIMCRVVLFSSGSQLRCSDGALCKCSSADPTLEGE